MSTELTTLQRKTIDHVINVLGRKSKHDILNEVVNAVAPALKMDADQRSNLYGIVSKVIEAHDDGKVEARNWLGAILKG